MTAPLRLGVVGTGSLGYHHARLLRDVAGVSFRGFYEANAERAGTVATELGIRAYPSLETLLEDVDAASLPIERMDGCSMEPFANSSWIVDPRCRLRLGFGGINVDPWSQRGTVCGIIRKQDHGQSEGMFWRMPPEARIESAIGG